MGVAERKERQRVEMRRAILDAARKLFIESGYSSVPIRRVAAQIEYSPAALYRYFKTKEDIFNALATEGFHLLASREALATAPPNAPPLEKLWHFFWGVYDFAKLYPEYFYLIFLDRSAPRLNLDPEGKQVVGHAYAQVAQLLDECVASGELAPGLDPYTIYDVLVSCVHGVAALYVCDRIPPGANADALARAVLDVAVGGLKNGALNSTNVRAGTPCALPKVRSPRRRR